MSGQQERWDGQERPGDADPRDATLDLSRLIEQVQRQIRDEGPAPAVGYTAASGARAAGEDGGSRSGSGHGGYGTGRASWPQPAGAGPELPASTPAGTGSGTNGHGEQRHPTRGYQSGEFGSQRVPRPESAADRPVRGQQFRVGTGAAGAAVEPAGKGGQPAIADQPHDGGQGARKVPEAAPAPGSGARPATPAVPGADVPPPDPPATEPEPGTVSDAHTAATSDAAAVQPAERTEPGSLADLRLRLERLPPGHPSSPYHVDGERKPPPPRLKHLELAPPEPGRPAAPWLAVASLPAADGAGSDETGAEQRTPNQPAAGAPGADAADLRADWERRWAVSADPDDESHLVTTADTSHNQSVAGAAQIAGEAGGRWPAGTFDQVTRLAPRAGDHRGDASPPDAARTAADGSWTWGSARLSRDLVRAADDALDQFREAEGRDLFGGFRDDGLTARLLGIAAMLEYGQIAPGSEHRALLEPDVFLARFADLLRRHPERTPEQLARRVPGALSYSFLFDAEHYSAGIWTMQDMFEAREFTLLARKNGWGSAENRCVFTVWRDPVSVLPFQVQFHTAASLEAQQLARTSATLINDPRIPATEADNLRSDIAAAWAALPAPPGQAGIGDFRRDRRPAQAEGSRLSSAPPPAGWRPPDRNTP